MNASSPIKTTDLCDAHPETQSCETQFVGYGRRRAFFGRIRTVKCHEDNALLKTVISGPGRGDVLVIDGGASYRCALMGDVIAGLGLQNGWAGAVINGVVRDVTALESMDFAVKALGSNPRRGAKSGAGQVDVPVAFGVLTCNTVEQAVDRSGAKSGNKGFDAAMTAIEMANLMRRLRKPAK